MTGTYLFYYYLKNINKMVNIVDRKNTLGLFIKTSLVTFKKRWALYWMKRSGMNSAGRRAMFFAGLFAPKYKSRCYLAKKGPVGYIAQSAVIEHSGLELTNDVYIGDRVTIYQSSNGGTVSLKKGVHLYSDIIIETGEKGMITIDEETHIQPRCSISAYKGSVKIGKRVEIAPNCAFYPYNHAIDPGELIRNQPLISKGDIIIEDDVWLGFGSVILENVCLGQGCVIGAGSIVTKNIPPGAIAVGNPAKIIGHRNNIKLVQNKVS
ncbi:acyltransferase [Desulfocastanea catecholica]